MRPLYLDTVSNFFQLTYIWVDFIFNACYVRLVFEGFAQRQVQGIARPDLNTGKTNFRSGEFTFRHAIFI